jgi:hypothetical protein
MISLPLSSVSEILDCPNNALNRLHRELEKWADKPAWKGPFSRLQLHARIDASRLAGEARSASEQSANQDMWRPRQRPNLPHPHVVGLHVKGALVPSAAPRGRKSRAPDRGTATAAKNKEPDEPAKAAVASNTTLVFFAMCFASERDAQIFVTRVRDFRRYALSLAFWPLMESVPSSKNAAETDILKQKVSELGLQPGEVDAVLHALSQPPAPPDPKLDRKIPIMTVNDDGRVLWHIPKKKKPLPQRDVSLWRVHRAHSVD